MLVVVVAMNCIALAVALTWNKSIKVLTAKEKVGLFLGNQFDLEVIVQQIQIDEKLTTTKARRSHKAEDPVA